MQIGLWDVKGGRPSVRHVPIFDGGEVMCPLEEAMPLRALLAPLAGAAASVMAALEALAPERPGALGFGSALSAVLDYVVRRPHRPCSASKCALGCLHAQLPHACISATMACGSPGPGSATTWCGIAHIGCVCGPTECTVGHYKLDLSCTSHCATLHYDRAHHVLLIDV